MDSTHSITHEYIDWRLENSPFKSGFKSWVINTWDIPSKKLLYSRSQEELQNLNTFLSKREGFDRVHAIVFHCWYLAYKYEYKPSYTALIYSLMECELTRDLYFSLYLKPRNVYFQPKDEEALQILNPGIIDQDFLTYTERFL